MNNEETMIIQPQGNDTTAETQAVNESTATEQKPQAKGNGKNVAIAAAAAGVAGVVGGAGVVAATDIIGNHQDEVSVVEYDEYNHDDDHHSHHEEHHHHHHHHEDAAAEANTDAHEVAAVSVEPTAENIVYMGDGENEGLALVEDPEEVYISYQDDPEEEVAVLGVYEHTTDDGIVQEAAFLTNGEEVAVVIDESGNGEADIVWIDENQNIEVDEGEIYDISDQHVEMQVYEDKYLAQNNDEPEMPEYEPEPEEYNASDDTDYGTDVDMIDF